MKAAVVGAGFSGLALAKYFLKRGVEVDLFDGKGIGGGASGVASGLLHPYAGEQVRRSYLADESLEEAKELIALAQAFSKEPVADFSGVIRKATPEQAKTLLSHKKVYGDIEVLDESTFLITSGIAVYSRRYLEGLFAGLQHSGLCFVRQKISSVEELKDYDVYCLAVGAEIKAFVEPDRFSLGFIKGQSLVCKSPEGIALKHGIVGKGYIVPIDDQTVHVGSTYERGLYDEKVDLEKALVDLKPKIRVLLPEWENIEVKECGAGVRVSRRGHYFPLTEKIAEKGYILTAMGSRGLLYHGYASKLLVESILTGGK